MGNQQQKPERIDRLGLLFGLLAILSWPFSGAHEGGLYALLGFNFLACLFLQRSTKGVLLARICLIVTLLGLVISYQSPLLPTGYDINPFATASRYSAFFMIVYFSIIGSKPSSKGGDSSPPPTPRGETPMTPNLWALVLFVSAVSLLTLGACTGLEILFMMAIPPAIAAPLAFVYSVLRGVGREAMRKSGTTDDLESDLPSV